MTYTSTLFQLQIQSRRATRCRLITTCGQVGPYVCNAIPLQHSGDWSVLTHTTANFGHICYITNRTINISIYSCHQLEHLAGVYEVGQMFVVHNPLTRLKVHQADSPQVNLNYYFFLTSQFFFTTTCSSKNILQRNIFFKLITSQLYAGPD